MRFKKGSNAEVFSKKEVSTGAWLPAEIISGNGHTYSVKYDCFPKSKEPVVERVPRKAIRPCPPPVAADDWVPGDLVEAFHNFSWKMARIMKVTDGVMFLVRIIGLSNIWIDKSFLRARQCWQDDKWFMVGKGLDIVDTSTGEKKSNKKLKQCVGDDCFPMEKNTELKMPHVVSTRMLKRKSLYGPYDLEAHPGAAQKKKLIGKGGSHQQIYTWHPSSTLEKVDTVAYPNVVLDENHMNSSFNVATAEFSILDASSGNDSFVIDRTSLDTDDCTSSVGSCNSVGNDARNLPFRCPMHYGSNMDDFCSDAESSCGVQYDKERSSVYSGEKSGLELHRPELHMYRSAIEGLYSLGPLSWENEAKLTNLRHVLHISDEEHLMLLRNLISSNRMLQIS